MKKLIQFAFLVIFVVSCVQFGLKKDCKAEQAQAIQPEEVGNEGHQEKLMEGDSDRNSD